MRYPAKFHVRHSTVFVIVALLMGSVLYEVTRTESMGRQSAARTQDISLSAPQPVQHRIRPDVRPDYIGRTAVATASTRPIQLDGDVAVAPGVAGTAGSSVRSETVGKGYTGTSGSSNAPGRVRSANGSGYAPGSYGMGGSGAWGGVSGMMRPEAATSARAKAPGQVKKTAAPKAKKAPAPKGAGPNAASGGATAVTGTSGELLAGGFTTGAAAVEPGAVASVQSPGAGVSPAAAPAATPEPMSMLLMGTGLVALYGVRRRFQ